MLRHWLRHSSTSGIQTGSIKVPTFLNLTNNCAIANYLDRETARIDGLIEKKARFIALLKEKRVAVIAHAVTKGLNRDAPMKAGGQGDR